MDDLNKGHPTSNLDNWALNYLRGMGEMGSSLTGVLTECQCIAWASHYWSGYVFTASSLSDWLFALEYNSLSVSHILPQETCALITTRPCYYWKGTTDSPRGQPCANDHTTHWILKIKCSLSFMPGPTGAPSKTFSYPPQRGGGLSGLTCAARHLIMKSSTAPSIHIYAHKDWKFFSDLRIAHGCCRVTRLSVQGATQVTWSKAEANITQDSSCLFKYLMC